MKDGSGVECPTRRFRWRRWVIGGIVVGKLLLALAIGLLPNLLETSIARTVILQQADRHLAPGRLEVERFDFAWTKPTRMSGFRLLDPSGEPTITSETAWLDQSLWNLLSGPKRRKLLRLDRAELDIRRAEDGEINLLAAIEALFEGDPRTKPGVWIVMDEARLRFDTPELEPIEAIAKIGLDFPPRGKPLVWNVALKGAGREGSTLRSRGHRDRPLPGQTGPCGLDFEVSLADWPVVLSGGGGGRSARASGNLSASFGPEAGWVTKGEVALEDLALSSTASVPSLRINWQAPGGESEDGARPVTIEVLASSVEDWIGVAGPVALKVDAIYEPNAARLIVRDGTVSGGGQRVEIRGQATALDTPAPLVEFSGLAPLRGEMLDRLFSEALGTAMVVEGERIEAQVSGRLDAEARADPLGRLDVAGRLSMVSGSAVGLNVGPMAVALTGRGGQFAIAPIETTLNNGRVRLVPDLARGEDGVWILKLREGSLIENAEINEDLSTQVLAFAVPVLERATHPTGLVSASVRRAEIPVGPGSEGRSPDVEATIVFDDVAFGPGPLADSILKLLNKEDATMRLDQPVLAVIADRRVHTRGLAIPIANVTAFELEGSVGFDRTLDLVARLPLTRQMMGNVPIVSDIFGGLNVEVPIGGDLSKPKLDKVAFNDQLREFGRELANRGISGGLNGVFNLLDRIRERRMERRESLRPTDGRP